MTVTRYGSTAGGALASRLASCGVVEGDYYYLVLEIAGTTLAGMGRGSFNCSVVSCLGGDILRKFKIWDF